MITKFEGEFPFLSNFASCQIVMDGVEYPTVEHAYQAAKTLKSAEREVIRQCATPGQAKRRGRHVTLRQNWNMMRFSVMRGLVMEKFKQEPYRTQLLSTGDCKIVEGNMWGDRLWGADLKTGKGENWLGIILMQVRAELRRLSD